MSLWSFLTGESPSSPKQALDMASTVSNCLKIYQKLMPGDPLEKIVAEKMVRISPTADSLWPVLDQVPVDGILGQRLLDRLLETAHSFPEAKRLHQKTIGNARTAKHADGALRRMHDTARTKEELLALLQLLSVGDSRTKAAEDKLFPQLRTCDDWEEVARIIPEGRLASLAVEKRMTSANTIEDILELLGDLPVGNPFHGALLKRLHTMQYPVDKWREVFENAPDGSEVGGIAFDKLLELGVIDDYLWLNGLSLSKDQESLLLEKLRELDVPTERWREIFEESSEWDEVCELAYRRILKSGLLDDLAWLINDNSLSDDQERAVTDKIESMKLEQGDWEKLRDESENSSSLELIAWKKLLEFVPATTSDLIQFYRDYVDSYDVVGDVEDAVLKRIFDIATPAECQLIALLATDDEYTELQKRAEKQVASP